MSNELTFDEAKNIIETKLLSHIEIAICRYLEGDVNNVLKTAITNTLDELFEMINTDEDQYLQITELFEREWGNGPDNYCSALQLMLQLASNLIGSGELHKENPSVAPSYWCTWYAQIVVDAYAMAMQDKFKILTSSYSDGNEFIGWQFHGEDGLNLSHLDRKYKKEFGQ